VRSFTLLAVSKRHSADPADPAMSDPWPASTTNADV